MGTKGQRSVAETLHRSAPGSAQEVSGGAGWVSLLILIHLICVLVALTSNLHRSSLQARLVQVLQPYLGLVNLDPDFTPYYLTHGGILDDDHFLEVQRVPAAGQDPVPAGKERTVLESANRWGFAARRYRRLAYAVAYHAQVEDDHITAALARATAGLVLSPGDLGQLVVRCWRHESQPRRITELVTGFPVDPADSQYQQSVYAADVWLADGMLQVQKRVTVQETARRERDSTSGDGKE
jgi:hypothetical protein